MIVTTNRAPGYPVSRGSSAFTAKQAPTMAAIRMQRERLTAGVLHVQTVITDVPSLSASSEERSP